MAQEAAPPGVADSPLEDVGMRVELAFQERPATRADQRVPAVEIPIRRPISISADRFVCEDYAANTVDDVGARRCGCVQVEGCIARS